MLTCAWDVLEGSAVCSEFFAVRHNPQLQEEFLVGLPSSYADAAAPMIDAVFHGMSLDRLNPNDERQAFLLATRKSAIVELALDLQMLDARVLDGDYQTIRDIALATRPTHNLARIRHALSSLHNVAIYARLLEAEKQRAEIVRTGQERADAVRFTICTVKQAIAEAVLGRSDFIVSDIKQIAIAKRLREELEAGYSELPRMSFMGVAPIRRVTRFDANWVPSVVIKEVALEPVDFVEETKEERFFSIISAQLLSAFTCRLFLKLPAQESNRHLVIEMSFLRSPKGGLPGFMELIRYSTITTEQVNQVGSLHSNSSTFAWLGFAIQDENYDIQEWDFWLSRHHPVYLWSPVFVDETILRLKRSFDAKAKFTVSVVPGELSLTLIRCEIEKVTIFWVDSGLQSLNTIKQNGGLWLHPGLFIPFVEPPGDDLFQAAYLATLHMLPNFLEALDLDTEAG